MPEEQKAEACTSAADGKEPSTQKRDVHCLSTIHKNLPVSKVVVHPLVLLSVVDHLNRAKKSANVRRVVGVLLGSPKADKVLDIANCFAVPFDEDPADSESWFLDHDYLENMYHMFHKVAARERIVGWYHTGPKLHSNDIAVNELFKKHTPDPVLVIIGARPSDDLALPTSAYVEVEEVHDDGTPPVKTFEHVASEIGAEEAEEVGVEHLLRDIKDQTGGTLGQRLADQASGANGLATHLTDIETYLRNVADGKLPMNHSIMYLLQEALNLMPDVESAAFERSQNILANDEMMCIYQSSLIRSVIALHNLIDNKLSLRETERDVEKPGSDDKDKEKGDKDKDKTDKDKDKGGKDKDKDSKKVDEKKSGDASKK